MINVTEMYKGLKQRLIIDLKDTLEKSFKEFEILSGAKMRSINIEFSTPTVFDGEADPECIITHITIKTDIDQP